MKQKPDDDYLSPLDQDTLKRINPAACPLFRDINGVYLLGSIGFRGDDWLQHKDGKLDASGVFSFAKCKNLFSIEDLSYSHAAFINQEAADKGEEELWGYVYYLAKLSDVDSKTFKFIKPTQKRRKYADDGYYFRDINHVYYLHDWGNYMFKVQSKNPSSFIAHCAFAQDDKSAFFMGKKIAKSEGNSFHKLVTSSSDHYVYADKNAQYENDNWTRVKTTKL